MSILVPPHPRTSVPPKLGYLRSYIDGSCVPKVGGWLEDGTLLSVIERDFLHVVERELPEVYLSVLCITQCYSVVTDAKVMSTHRTDVDGLDTPYATIVLQLDAREVAQGIGHRVRVEFLQHLTVQFLTRHHLPHSRLRHNDNLTHVLYRIQPALGKGKRLKK